MSNSKNVRNIPSTKSGRNVNAVKSEKPLYEMKGRPKGMALEDWYEAIYSQWYNRESWCQMYERPLMEQLPTRRHFPHANRSIIRFNTPRHSMDFTLKDRSRPVIFGPGKRLFQQYNALTKFY